MLRKVLVSGTKFIWYVLYLKTTNLESGSKYSLVRKKLATIVIVIHLMWLNRNSKCVYLSPTTLVSSIKALTI